MIVSSLLAVCVLTLFVSLVWAAELWSVSVSPAQPGVKERIVGFEIRVRSGRIASVPFVPIGWHISVENEPSWYTKISGSIVVGAAALDLASLKDFLLVEETSLPGLKFELDGALIVSEDFQKERRIPVGSGELKLRKSPGPIPR
jgi:hypothetical protein